MNAGLSARLDSLRFQRIDRAAMSRHIIILALLCGLLGVICTIALAWTCAALVNPGSAYADFQHAPRADGGSDVEVRQRAFGHSRINCAQCAELKLHPDTGAILIARWNSGGAEYSETQAGWPFRALSCRNKSEVTLVTGNTGMQMHRSGPDPIQNGWELPSFRGGPFGGAWRAIPLRPMWSGLIADIVLWTGVWCGLFSGVGAMRRRHRRAHGRCPGCGYDLRSSGVPHERCPECGATHVRRSSLDCSSPSGANLQ